MGGLSPDDSVALVTDGRNDPVTTLRLASSNVFIGPIVSLFSIFAIFTSYTGFYVGLENFFKDLLPSRQGLRDPLIFSLVLLPPLLVSLSGNTDMFLTLLDSAGTFGITTLFGIFPPLMALKMREMNESEGEVYVEYVPGGKPVLWGTIATAFLVMALKIETYKQIWQ